jgi:Spy/CpxP family protein refolding chaperone
MKISRIAVATGLVGLAVTLMAADVAHADGRHTRRGGPGDGGRGPGGSPLERLGQVIDLTENQQTQLQTLHERFRAEAEALRESGSADREQFEVLRESHREQVQALFTEEQRATLERLHAEREANRPARGDGLRGRPGRRGPEGEDRPRLVEALGLTEEQQSQIETLRQEMRGQVQALRESSDDRAAFREAARALHEVHRAQVRSLLTEQQQGLLDELHANRPRRGGADVDDAQVEGSAAQKAASAIETRSWGSLKAGRR